MAHGVLRAAAQAAARSGHSPPVPAEIFKPGAGVS